VGLRFGPSCRYDEQYNDWAKRYLRERLYNADGVDRCAEYLYGKLLPPMTIPKKKLEPTKVTADKEYQITECKAFARLENWD